MRPLLLFVPCLAACQQSFTPMPLAPVSDAPVEDPGPPELDFEAVCGDEGLAFLDTLSGPALVEAVHEATAGLDCNDYAEARLFMMEHLEPAQSGWIESVYIGLQVEPDGTTTPGSLNTEHTWPQSQGADVNPARCDLHHLYPADGGVNSRRSNLAFGHVSEASWAEAGSARGVDGLGETVFEPRDAHKGNVARSLLYFAARYDYPVEAGYLDLLQEWSAFDPPDRAELDRSLAIADEQGAVNPYVLCPWTVEAL